MKAGEGRAASSAARPKSATVRGYLEELGLGQASDVEAFLSPRLAALSNPETMRGRREAIDRIARAIRGGERIVVFGDYDCDGMTATAILADAIATLGGSVSTELASRFEGGYGFSAAALARVRALGPSLVVTCDCGSSDAPSLRELAANGIDAVVIDHHLVPDEPLPVVAFLNPHQPGCEFPFKGMASCGLAFSVAAGLRRALDRPLDVKAYLDLVAVGTIADVMPLTGDNRALVRAGLELLERSPRPGLGALLDRAGVERGQPLTATDVAFKIAPRLNAPGRLGSPKPALEVLLARDPAVAASLAESLEVLSIERRAQQDRIEEEAESDVRARPLQRSVVVGREGWNHGIVGIVAGRLAEKHERPAIVVGFESEVGVGSVRGPAGFPLYTALTACADLLERHGGHQAAAGLTVKRAHFEEFRQRFDQACAAQALEAVVMRDALSLVSGDRLDDVVGDLMLLEPTGEGNPAPVFRLEATVRSAREVRGSHLKLEVETDARETLEVFGPRLGRHAALLRGRVELTGVLGRKYFRGRAKNELLLERVRLLGSPSQVLI